MGVEMEAWWVFLGGADFISLDRKADCVEWS